jgi:hypothetical protein
MKPKKGSKAGQHLLAKMPNSDAPRLVFMNSRRATSYWASFTSRSG